MYRLMRHGYKAYLVGGGVRDLLLDRKPKDFDIATDATPRKIKELFRNSRIIGRRFKLIHVFFRGNKIIEVSTFRDVTEAPETEEGEAPETPAIIHDNTYGTEVTDALRRDLTINGLFYDLGTFSIIDYVGGMRDIRDGIVRIIGDPDERFAEDPVRLMRVCRHAAKSGFSIEQRCYESLKRNTALIKNSAPMRVFEELKKDFSAGYALKTLRLLHECGLLTHLLPEVAANNGALLDPVCDFARALERSDELVLDERPRSATVVLALIAMFSRAPVLEGLAEQFKDSHDVAEHVSSCFRSLAVPRKEREKVDALLSAWHMLILAGDNPGEIRNLDRKGLLGDFELLIEILYGKGPELDLLTELKSSSGQRPGRSGPHSGSDEEGEADTRRHGRRRRRRGGRSRQKQIQNF